MFWQTITKQQCFMICPQRKLRTWSSCTASLFHQTNNVLTIFPLLFHLWWSTQRAEGHLLVLPVLAPLLYLLRQSDYVNKVHLQLLAEMQLAIRALHTEIGDISPVLRWIEVRKIHYVPYSAKCYCILHVLHICMYTWYCDYIILEVILSSYWKWQILSECTNSACQA